MGERECSVWYRVELSRALPFTTQRAAQWIKSCMSINNVTWQLTMVWSRERLGRLRALKTGVWSVNLWFPQLTALFSINLFFLEIWVNIAAQVRGNNSRREGWNLTLVYPVVAACCCWRVREEEGGEGRRPGSFTPVYTFQPISELTQNLSIYVGSGNFGHQRGFKESATLILNVHLPRWPLGGGPAW